MAYLYPGLVVGFFLVEVGLRLSFYRDYRRRQTVAGDYQAARSRVGLAGLTLSTGLTLVWAGGGLAAGLSWLRLSVPDLVVVPLAAGLVIVVSQLVLAPISWWSVFGVEAGFGFNRQTVAGWWRDLGLGTLLSVGLTAGLLGLLLFVWQWIGAGFFLLLPLVLGLAGLVLEVVWPLWFEPWFQRLRPLPTGPLADRLGALSRTAGLGPLTVWVADTSRRSAHANAWFTGLGRQRRIVLADNLVHNFPDEEIEAVVAHELGHWRHGHLFWRLVGNGLGLLLGSVLLWTAWTGQWAGAAFGLGADDRGGFLLAVAFLTGRLALPLVPLAAWFSRRQEYQADRAAAGYLGSGQALAAALRRLGEGSRQIFDPPRLRRFYDSHPSLADRLARLGDSPIGGADASA